jgi:RNase P/RNase MRP subunit p30
MDFITINEANWDKARKEIDKASASGGKKPVVIQGQDIEFNRLSLENKKVSALILRHKGQKDRLKERGSSLNQVLCKIASETDKAVLIDFKELLDSNGRERALILGRLIQNIMLLQKYNVKTGIINKSGRDDYGLFSLLLALGSSTKFAQNTVNFKLFS